MDPNSPTYSNVDVTVTGVQNCEGLAPDSIQFQFGVYKLGNLYFAEMYQPAENDGGDIYNHEALGDSLISAETFGFGGSFECMDENDNPISCYAAVTAKVDLDTKKLVGDFYFEDAN